MGIFQAVYTAGAVLPTPVASCRSALKPASLDQVSFTPRRPPHSLDVCLGGPTEGGGRSSRSATEKQIGAALLPTPVASCRSASSKRARVFSTR